jgi:hypothetical protein
MKMRSVEFNGLLTTQKTVFCSKRNFASPEHDFRPEKSRETCLRRRLPFCPAPD